MLEIEVVNNRANKAKSKAIKKEKPAPKKVGSIAAVPVRQGRKKAGKVNWSAN